MSITAYTTYDEIRGVIGVASNELPDSVLSVNMYWYALKHEFSEIDSGLLSDLDSAIANPNPTDTELAFIEAATMFATFSVSNQLMDSLPMFAPKSIIEGKSDVTRFSDSPYAKTIESVAKSYLRFKKILTSAYAVFLGGSTSSVSTAIPLVGASSPTYDPVTGT